MPCKFAFANIINSLSALCIQHVNVCCCDRDDSLLTSHQMQSLIEYLPTEDEKLSLKNYLKGAESETKMKSLCECEKFMVAMKAIKNPERMIKSLVFK